MYNLKIAPLIKAQENKQNKKKQEAERTTRR